MKRTAIALLLATQLLAALPAAATIDAYDDDQSHPLRVAAYLINPIGYAMEWLIFRPFHYMVSAAAPVFGHTRHGRKADEEK